MMTDIKADYALFREKILALSDMLIRLDREIGQIACYTEDLDIFWDGDANTAYISETGEDLVRMEAVVLCIRETVASARKAFDLYMRNEREVKKVLSDIL